MPSKLPTWTWLMFMIFNLFNLVNSSQVVLDSFSISEPPPRGEYSRTCPLPQCARCPSKEEIRAPGIGLALETSHGTAVVKLHDGTYQSIALVKGDPIYTTLLGRLTARTKKRTPEEIDSPWEMLQYVKVLTQRNLNKLLGRPATPEIAVLAAMVSALYKETQTWLGAEKTVTAAVLSFPDHIRLTDEEINDIFDYLNLKNLMFDPNWPTETLYATSAAYSGYGRGLCTAYIDAYECEREEWDFPDQWVLHVDFNSESLSGTIKNLRTARDGSVEASFVDFNLGYDMEDFLFALAPDFYWETVSTRIRNLAVPYKPHITELILTGTLATDVRFQAALKDALYDIIDENDLARLGDYAENAIGREERKELFEFATARGSAEMAKRKQEGPVRCAQSDECRERREHEGEKVL